ncbi:M50 family metallopeptidase [Paenibacillus aquistagni]|uniref:Peptidase M50B-like n=1 Tax=Paenibacillus aquistagni TaxID=1852522 RepID=A0A1X7JYU8_9BACL|nr:M50 family metallopeptidase [Paenibacillus aquistagni]SMG33740.1 Peptidase M50B-like [Paenibacillus aquistagni]
MNRGLKTVLFLLGAWILTRLIPFSFFFRNVDTLIHEFGHALMTLLLSGKVQFIYLFADHSGVTQSIAHYKWQFILISLAGYIISSAVAMLLFLLYSRILQKFGLILLTVVAIISLFFFIRNTYGVLWTLGFIAINICVYLLPWERVKEFYYLLLAFICLVDSFVSTIILVTLSIQQPSAAGDAANLAHVTGVPALIWSILFLLIAFGCATVSMDLFLRSKRRQPTVSGTSA